MSISNYLDLANQKSVKEAIGFYLFCVVGTIILHGGVYDISSRIIVPYFELRFGTITEAIFSSLISFLVLKEKKLLGNPGFILLALLAGLITLYIGSALSGLFFGALSGLIIPAYLTTRPANNVWGSHS